MNDKSYPVLDDFSLIKSGLLHKLTSRLKLGGTSKNHLKKRVLFLIIITWLPLLILSAIQGLAIGNAVNIPFLKDFATQAKFLIILPLLIFAEGAFDLRLKELTLQFFKSGILEAKDIARFDVIKKKVGDLSNAYWPDIIIFALILINLVPRLVSAGANHTSIWIFRPENDAASLSLAGIYVAIICGPIFQFLLMRWLWRWILWFIYFRELARMPIKLSSAHPDMAGGLGFLGYPPGPFIQVVFALAILFSTAIAEFIYFQHEKLQSYYPIMVAFALLAILMNVMPLLVFIKPMAIQRRKGFFEYSTLIHNHHLQFDDKWHRNPYTEKLPGISDPSSMADFNSSFEVVKNMKVFPFDIKIMISSIVIAILPMLPLLAFEYNIGDIVLKALKMLV
jgi:hypothetical protein